MDKKFSAIYEGFKYGIFEGLFVGISLVSEDVIVSGFLVGSLVGSLFVSSEGLKDRKLDGKFFENYLGGEGRLYIIVKL